MSLPQGPDLRFRLKVKYQNFNTNQVHAFLNKGLTPSVQALIPLARGLESLFTKEYTI